MGDLNFNGMVTGLDARIAVRIAIGTEEMGDLTALSWDTDMDGSLTMSDARAILRAGLYIDYLTTGFDEHGYPNIFGVFGRNEFTMQIEQDDETLTIAVSGENLFFNVENTYYNSDYLVLGFIVTSDSSYMKLYRESSGKYYAFEGIASLIEKYGGITMDELTAVCSQFDYISDIDDAEISVTEYNGETVLAYDTFTEGDTHTEYERLYVSLTGELIAIETGYYIGISYSYLSRIPILSLSGSVDDSLFSLSGYTVF